MFLHHCVPFWQPNPCCAGETDALTYIKMSKFEHFCWIWDYKNRLFEKKLKDIGSEYLRIRLEDIIDPNGASDSGIRLLGSFLGLPELEISVNKIQNHAVNKSDGKFFPEWRHWTKERAIILHKYCTPLMKRYGYGFEPEWNALIKEY